MLKQRQGYLRGRQATRRLFMVLTLAIASVTSGKAIGAERWPSRPIVLIVSAPAGSGPDTRARDLAARIGLALGQPIVVENISGAGGIVAMEQTRRASPDGHHFVFTHIGAVVINPWLFKTLPYDPVRDFDPVSLVLGSPMILAAPSSLGIDSLAQLREMSKRKPGTMMYASAGNGTPPHIFFEQLKAATQMLIDHVPFKGSPGVVQALMGAQVAVGMEGGTAMMPLIEAGKVRALAVTGDVRMPSLPQVPTFSELGIPDIGLSWLAVMAPKGTLPEAVAALNREITRVLALPDLQRNWATFGSRPLGGSPAVLAERIRVELPRWKSVIDRAGIRPD